MKLNSAPSALRFIPFQNPNNVRPSAATGSNATPGPATRVSDAKLFYVHLNMFCNSLIHRSQLECWVSGDIGPNMLRLYRSSLLLRPPTVIQIPFD